MKLYLILLLITIVLSPLLFSFSIRKIIGIEKINENNVYQFYQDKVFREKFISPQDYLNSVVLKLKNTGWRNKQPITFKLIKQNQAIREVNLNGSNIGDGDWVRLSFLPLAGSKNQEYEIEISSPTSRKEDFLGVHIYSEDKKDTAALITYHSIPSRWELIKNIYVGLIHRISNDKVFLFLWCALLLTTYIIIRYANRVFKRNL